MFQHTAARRRLDRARARTRQPARFNTQPPEGGWPQQHPRAGAIYRFNTQPPEGGWHRFNGGGAVAVVSTHSRPKAAGPENCHVISSAASFQHTAARRRLVRAWLAQSGGRAVSTHSRPKAAGSTPHRQTGLWACFNTQPPEGGWRHVRHRRNLGAVSTHSRPKAAGAKGLFKQPVRWFQHTAARRRLEQPAPRERKIRPVSTHSRPKAAGGNRPQCGGDYARFNTQPPEGGWLCRQKPCPPGCQFQHTAARRRLGG